MKLISNIGKLNYLDMMRRRKNNS